MGLGMGCEHFRDELSARLDGEDDPGMRAAVDQHLAGCEACTQWWERAGAVTRIARAAAAQPVPTLSPKAMATVLAAASTRKSKMVAALWMALLAVGLGQFLLGVAQISNYAVSQADHAHTGAVASVSSGHLWHESAAWNVAIGAGMAWLAWRRNRPAALIPVMTAFVAVLGLLTANDALAGRVDAARILSHGLVLIGYALLLVINLPRFRGTQPPAATRLPGGGWTGGRGDDDGGSLAPVLPFPVRASAAFRVNVRTRRAA
jgi:predicted anti-sigma-YlaC factor YlaD